MNCMHLCTHNPSLCNAAKSKHSRAKRDRWVAFSWQRARLWVFDMRAYRLEHCWWGILPAVIYSPGRISQWFVMAHTLEVDLSKHAACWENHWHLRALKCEKTFPSHPAMPQVILHGGRRVTSALLLMGWASESSFPLHQVAGERHNGNRYANPM